MIHRFCGIPAAPFRLAGALIFSLSIFATIGRAQTRPGGLVAATDGKPTLWLVGDSTVRNGNRPYYGWSEVIDHWFDKTRIHVQDQAIAGRSSRTFTNEGRWDRIMAVAAKGDFVLIQMGHNDGGSITDAKGRASLPGLGDETQDVTTAMGKKETVHTFGWYMGKFVTDSHDKGMTAIICSPIPHYPAQPVVAGQLEQSKGATWNMVTWSEEVAKKQNAPFIQLNGLILSHFVGMDPQEIMAKYYSPDRTHTQGAGAILNAQCVVDGIRSLADCPLKSYLLDTPETFTLPTTRANGRPTTLPADSNRAAPGAQ